MLRYSSILLFLSVILFASCQQDIDEVLGDDPTPPPPPPTVFDTLVTKLYWVENQGPFIGDTAAIYVMTYDSRQRMTSVDTTLLVKKIEIEKTGPDPAIGDTLAFHYYTYDDKKRG